MSTDKWFHSHRHSGWHKDMDPGPRRRLVLKAHGNNYLSAARGKQALVNVTEDAKTKRVAKIDADYFFKRHAETGK